MKENGRRAKSAGITFDFNGMMASVIGSEDGLTRKDLASIGRQASIAYGAVRAAVRDDYARASKGLEWTRLPYQDRSLVNEIIKTADGIASSFDNVISLGIGGSYLGLKAAHEALLGPYYNDFESVRRGRPRIFFDGNNLDPDTISALLGNLDPKRTFVIVISKSGETIETKAAFSVVEAWLKRGAGKHYRRNIFAITDPSSGSLRKRAEEENAGDPLGFRSLPVVRGVGGRYSELNVGLLLLSIAGLDIREALDGAAAMEKLCMRGPGLGENPALMYASCHAALYRKKDKRIGILMPFCEGLKYTADWYVQLLAESLGKKYDRSGHVVNVGRTPVSARGTSDLHSIQQNNVQGMNDKAVTFIRVKAFAAETVLPDTRDFLAGRKYSKLLGLALEATEWALARERRPSCVITLPRVDPYYWGGLIFFFEMATAFEGELLNVNAFDQPGVEGYKDYMYFKLGRPGLPARIVKAIKNSSIKRDRRYII